MIQETIKYIVDLEVVRINSNFKMKKKVACSLKYIVMHAWQVPWMHDNKLP